MKTKTKKQIDNKKPPGKDSPPKENEKEQEQEKKENIEELEKKVYEEQGQEHIEPPPEEQNPQPNIAEEQIKEKPKKQMLIKPRETYLQDKLSKMECNKNVMSSIKKELGEKIKTIIKDENVLITEVPKDLKKYIKKELEGSDKNAEQNYIDKQKYREVKKLNDELTSLKKNFKKMEENEKLLQDEGFAQLNKSQKASLQNIMFDKSIKEQQLKLIQDKKGKLADSIRGIESQIKYIMEDHQTMTNKEKLKEFIDNFKRDKEIIEIRAKKYLKESKEREQRMQNSLNKAIEERKKQMEEIEKIEKSKKEENYLKFKTKAKEIEQKHSKQSEAILIKYKPYINQKPEKTKKQYLYNKRYESFIKREEKLYKDQTNKNKKEKERISYNFEEIGKFAEQFDEKIENRKYEQEQKKMELSEKWAKNREKLPKSNYQEPINEKDNKSDEEKLSPEETPIQKYGKEVRENFIPEIDEKKKKEREDKIFSLEDPKKASKKYTLNKQKKKRVLLKKRNNSKPSKFKWELKIGETEQEKLETIINQNLIHKPKKITLPPITRTTTINPTKKKDYLTNIIKDREKKRAKSSKSRDDPNYVENDMKEKSDKWEKEINNDKRTLFDNINNVKQQAKILDEKADLKEKQLIEHGGIQNNPELGRNVTNLLIDSIQAKINILKKMNKV